MELIVFIHVNKCGGKSIDQALQPVLQNYREVHGLVGRPYTYTPGELPILFIRDPITRFLSSLKYHIQQRGPLLGKYIHANEVVSIMKQQPSIREKFMHTNLHFWYSLSRYVTPECCRTTPWFFVGTMENIQHDFQQLCQQLNVYPQLEHYNRTKKKKNNGYLTFDNIHFLRTLYQNDYTCIYELCKQGYIPWSYYHTITTCTRYSL